MSPQKPMVYANNGPHWRYHLDSLWRGPERYPRQPRQFFQVLAATYAPQNRPRPDYDPHAAIDKANTAVELLEWKMEMDMHFVYTLAQNTLSKALLASVGPLNKTLLKVDFHPTPLHFLNPRQIVDCMFKTHASLTGPDLKKLRAPLSEPLKAVTELELYMRLLN